MNHRQKTAFGEYLVEEIKKAKMLQEEFYTAVGIKKPYFYDLLTATPPPTALQDSQRQLFTAALSLKPRKVLGKCPTFSVKALLFLLCRQAQHRKVFYGQQLL